MQSIRKRRRTEQLQTTVPREREGERLNGEIEMEFRRSGGGGGRGCEIEGKRADRACVMEDIFHHARERKRADRACVRVSVCVRALVRLPGRPPAPERR